MAEESFLSYDQLPLPARFPKKRMGYIGSFFDKDFDLDLFEYFIQHFPQYGFILSGRTDQRGKERVQDFKEYPNFQVFDWMPRDQIAGLWQLLDITLLFYRPQRTQDGAFPIKILESLYFHVPWIATEVPKTEDLAGYFCRSSQKEVLVEAVEKLLTKDEKQLSECYRSFQARMDPTLHLTRVAEFLRSK